MKIGFTQVEEISGWNGWKGGNTNDYNAGWNGWKGGNTNQLMIIMYEIEFTQVEQL